MKRIALIIFTGIYFSVILVAVILFVWFLNNGREWLLPLGELVRGFLATIIGCVITVAWPFIGFRWAHRTARQLEEYLNRKCSTGEYSDIRECSIYWMVGICFTLMLGYAVAFGGRGRGDVGGDVPHEEQFLFEPR